MSYVSLFLQNEPHYLQAIAVNNSHSCSLAYHLHKLALIASGTDQLSLV